MAASQGRRRIADAGAVVDAPRSPMLMPLLVSLTDSEVYAVAGVVAQASNGVKDGGGVLEEVGSAWLPIDQEPLLSDLHVEPIYGDVQPGGQFGCAEGAGFMVPSFAGRAPLDAGDMTDPLYGVGENLLVAIGGTMALGREDGGDLDVEFFPRERDRELGRAFLSLA